MELKKGQKLRVKEFDKRPVHWDWDGEMNKWMRKIVTLKDIDDEYLIIYEDKGEWAWKESDFQIVFDTWEDVYNMMRNECFKYDVYCYNDECYECKLKKYAGAHYECYTDLFNSKDYKKLAENFKKMFGMECYVLQDEGMENLKEQMDITTLVQLRDGTIGMVFLNDFSDDNKGIFGITTACIAYLSEYKDNLKSKDGNISFDIMKIRFPKGKNNYHLVKNFFKKELESIDIDWDWKRKEEPITKDVSLEEINALLKEKYPDVEKFNLPIDNDK